MMISTDGGESGRLLRGGGERWKGWVLEMLGNIWRTEIWKNRGVIFLKHF